MMDEKNIETLLNATKDPRTNSLPFTSSAQWSENKEFHRIRVLKKGWLEKQCRNIFSPWKAKWSVLTETDLICYENEYENKSSANIICLKDKDVVEIIDSNNNEDEKFENNKYLFKIVQKNQSSSFTTNSALRKADIFTVKSGEVRKSWIKALKKVMFGHLGGAIFGSSISNTLMEERKKNPNQLVPEIVDMCCHFIDQYGLQTEGIFRLSCRLSVLKRLREQFDRGLRPSLILPIENGSDSSLPPMSTDTPTTSNIHTVCCLLKAYLLELPEPIIPVHFYEDVMTAVTRLYNIEPEAALQNLFVALNKLPPNNYNLLSHLCSFLNRVGDNEKHNRMTHANLGKIFCNAVIRPEVEDAALLMGTADNRSTALKLMMSKMDVVFDEKYKPFNHDSNLKRGVVRREKKKKGCRGVRRGLGGYEEEEEDGSDEDCLKGQPRRSSSLKEINWRYKAMPSLGMETLAGKGNMVNGYDGAKVVGDNVFRKSSKIVSPANEASGNDVNKNNNKNDVKFHSIDEFLNQDLDNHVNFYQDVSECLMKNGISLHTLDTQKKSKRHCFLEGHTGTADWTKDHNDLLDGALNTPHHDLSQPQLVSLCATLKKLLSFEKNRVSYLESQLKLRHY